MWDCRIIDLNCDFDNHGPPTQKKKKKIERQWNLDSKTIQILAKMGMPTSKLNNLLS